MMPVPIRPNVLQMEPYSPGKPISEVKRELGLDRVVKLASNENPLGPSPKAVAALQLAAQEANSYPDGAAHDFRETVSAKFGVPYSQIIVGNGSDELIHLLGLVFLDGPDDEVIVGHPSFVRYDAAAFLAGSKLVRVPLDGEYRHDLAAMLSAVTPRTKLLFIANPNNPTGTLVTKDSLEVLLENLPDHVTVILDEAYYEFAKDEPGYPSSTDYILAGRNVVGLRTLSKAYGLAGIRLGYGFAPPSIADAINRAREPFNVNALAQVAGVAALGDDEHVRRTIENNRIGMKRIAQVLVGLGAHVVPSHANFVFADIGQPARPVFQALLERGIIVRSGEMFGSPTCIRVSVGTEEENELFAKAIEEVLQRPVPA
jgi:histidinol-phosphate aminotransferase